MGLFSRRKPSPAFVVPPEIEQFASKHQTLTTRRFFPRLAVWNGTRFGDPHDYLVDSGSDFSIVSHDFAALHHFNLPMNPVEADLIDLEGLGGVRKAWLTKRFVRFEKLRAYRFSFHFVVPVPDALSRQLA